VEEPHCQSVHDSTFTNHMPTEIYEAGKFRLWKSDLKHPDAFEITVTEGHMELTQKRNGIGTTAPDINKLRYCIYSWQFTHNGFYGRIQCVAKRSHAKVLIDIFQQQPLGIFKRCFAYTRHSWNNKADCPSKESNLLTGVATRMFRSQIGYMPQNTKYRVT